MHIIWFKDNGKWMCVEVFDYDTVDIVRDALKCKGYEVSDKSFNPAKTSVVSQERS